MIKCELCNREFKSLQSLGLHLSHSHKDVSHKDYYDTHLKKEGDGICPVCGKPTKWKGGLHGYARTCSISCGQKHPETRDKLSKTNMERYGATNPYGSKQIREQIENTMQKRYHVKNAYSIPRVHEKALQNSIVKPDGNHSSWETLLENALVSKNIKYEKQYKDSRYPFYCDFYLSDADVFVEINGFWMHGQHYFDSTNIDDINKLNLWKTKPNRIYKSAIYLWTIVDLYKKDIAIKNNLNYIVLWTLDDINNYISTL